MSAAGGRYRHREVPVVRCSECVHGWRLCGVCMAAKPIPAPWMGEGRCFSFESRSEGAGRPHAGRVGKH